MKDREDSPERLPPTGGGSGAWTGVLFFLVALIIAACAGAMYMSSVIQAALEAGVK